QAGLVEDPEVVAHGWLRAAQGFHKGAGTDLAGRLSRDQAEEAQAGRVGKGREAPGKLGGFGLGQWCREDRRAAGLGLVESGKGEEHLLLVHGSSYIDTAQLY